MTTPRYSVRKYSETPSRNGVSWHCEIVKDGRTIGTAEDAGRGGEVECHFINREEQAAFAAFAATQTFEEVTGEPIEDFVEHLITVMQVNRSRRVPYVFEGDDWSLSCYRRANAGLSFDQVREILRTRYADRNPLIWDKTQSAFVPVAA